MTNLTGKDRSVYVQNLFTRIAGKYDLMNRLMTLGQDVRWRNEVVRLAKLTKDSHLLDLGSGTGDLARAAQQFCPAEKIVAADFTFEMMRAGRLSTDEFNWANADALAIPFASESFTAVVSGYLMRNVIDRDLALQEQKRVLKPGGRIVILDTTRPRKNIFSPFIWIHLHIIIPLLGTLLSGHSDAYTYLPDSTEEFMSGEELLEKMDQAGFTNTGFRRFMFGTMAIHWGQK
jgi:demethylmenaquinone methyltransferase/2-methoxy-6-polyprenyl-1,4-benzoquinol methylase